MPSRNSGNGPFELIVAALIRKKRLEHGLLIEALAVAANSNRKTIADLESGYIHIKVTHLETLCPIFGMRVSQLMAEAEEILISGGPVPKSNPRQPSLGWVPRSDRPALANPIKSNLPFWAGGLLPTLPGEQHDAATDELRRRNRERDLAPATELCEAHEG